jgi:hypothetical protein
MWYDIKWMNKTVLFVCKIILLHFLGGNVMVAIDKVHLAVKTNRLLLEVFHLDEDFLVFNAKYICCSENDFV